MDFLENMKRFWDVSYDDDEHENHRRSRKNP